VWPISNGAWVKWSSPKLVEATDLDLTIYVTANAGNEGTGFYADDITIALIATGNFGGTSSGAIN